MGFPGNNWTACSVHRFFHPAIPKFPKIKTKELLKHQSQLTIFAFFLVKAGVQFFCCGL